MTVIQGKKANLNGFQSRQNGSRLYDENINHKRRAQIQIRDSQKKRDRSKRITKQRTVGETDI